MNVFLFLVAAAACLCRPPARHPNNNKNNRLITLSIFFFYIYLFLSFFLSLSLFGLCCAPPEAPPMPLLLPDATSSLLFLGRCQTCLCHALPYRIATLDFTCPQCALLPPFSCVVAVVIAYRPIENNGKQKNSNDNKKKPQKTIEKEGVLPPFPFLFF